MSVGDKVEDVGDVCSVWVERVSAGESATVGGKVGRGPMPGICMPGICMPGNFWQAEIKPIRKNKRVEK